MSGLLFGRSRAIATDAEAVKYIWLSIAALVFLVVFGAQIVAFVRNKK